MFKLISVLGNFVCKNKIRKLQLFCSVLEYAQMIHTPTMLVWMVQ